MDVEGEKLVINELSDKIKINHINLSLIYFGKSVSS